MHRCSVHVCAVTQPAQHAFMYIVLWSRGPRRDHVPQLCNSPQDITCVLSCFYILGIRNAQTHASHLNHAAFYEFERLVITEKGYAKSVNISSVS